MPDQLPAEEVRELVVRLPSADDAARIMLIKALKNTQKDNNEWGGLIFQGADGQYYALNPMTSKSGKEVKISGKPYDKGDKFAGIYHTHPAGDQSKHFSPGDVETASTHKVPSYVAFQEGGDMRVFEPGTSKTHRFRTHGRISDGRVVIPQLITEQEEQRRLRFAAALKHNNKK